jgi:flagellar biosynthesis/type III secretory pathway protein FliH
MNNAVEAVTRAENDSDAVTYAGNLLARARDALTQMHAEASSKRYESAKSYAAEAIATAERAISEGRAGATRSRNDAAALLSELNTLAEDTRQGIDAARSAGLSLNYNQVEQDYDTARNTTDQAQGAYTGGRYQDSINLGRTARSGFADINRQLSEAATEIARKK